MLELSIRWFGENSKINMEAVVQVVLQRMWFDTTNSNKKSSSSIFINRRMDYSKYNYGQNGIRSIYRERNKQR